MYPMERKSQSATTRLTRQLQPHISRANFYRFCQMLEQSQPDAPPLGSTWRIGADAVRFRPHPGMGFPAGEFKRLEFPEIAGDPVTARVTFMGLYGVESPLPGACIDDIAQRRDGYDAVTDFLDIFNHRLITQYYRIWRKYSWPASFEEGGKDKTSQYLLSLAGLGLKGSARNIATPISRFLALSGIMRLPTRTSEGIHAIVRLLAPDTDAEIIPHDAVRVALQQPLTMSVSQPALLAYRPVMGSHATDVNHQVHLRLTTRNQQEAMSWLPGEQLHTDLLALLAVYLGARLDVRMTLTLARELLPDAALSCMGNSRVLLGRTAVMRPQAGCASGDSPPITINLGRYQRLKEHYNRRDTDEEGNYRD
ncbi:type VI secretion system baseplate subunit TssG [Erwinia sorbitola]|uniref:Type VI secretion system baseplate subunit TssG n=1 Tax=Erwinia sorbitola TaxID=2681984 RepID=A0A6I6EVP0_9GAMM|nr:type VI secretion system baseplate subunit TssG [Erwinia sorbitola]QGU89179.1 type VI secretion system baseplate subunit TssG [Erwinia sorbitola]